MVSIEFYTDIKCVTLVNMNKTELTLIIAHIIYRCALNEIRFVNKKVEELKLHCLIILHRRNVLDSFSGHSDGCCKSITHWWH